jgi:membrane associated rhomboid family serine protease
MFFVFPLNSKPDWRKPPVFTLLLILINCIVFFGPQARDEDRADRAAEFYVKSSLPRIELPLYLSEIKERSTRREQARAAHVEMLLAKGYFAEAFDIMDNDRPFMARLLAGKVVAAEDPRLAEWTTQRARYAGLRGDQFTERWTLRPDLADPATLLSATFLHGSTSHLVGNMVFLFAFGYTVEMAIGGSLFLAFYLVAGLAGNLVYLGANWGSPIGVLGASGAIAGLMAMYAVLYGTRRIRFFYQLLFYFDYVKAPAIILLPAWIANELVQNWLSPHSGIAYLVHAGGLVGGAALIWIWRWRRPNARVALPEAPREDPWQAEFKRAKVLLEKLQIDEARTLYAQLSEQRPEHLGVLKAYFGLAKLAPADPHFHRSAARAFALSAQDEATTQFVREVLALYLAQALPRPRLSPAQLGRVGLRLARAACFDEAMRIEAMLTRLDPQHSELNALRLALTSTLLRAARRDEAKSFAERLRQAAPHSSEARLAADLLAS